MRPVALLLLLAAAAPSLAGDAKPNTLTPKEAADGWILLFDGATTFGWKNDVKNPWIVKNGYLEATEADHATLRCATRFSDLLLAFDYYAQEDSQTYFELWKGESRNGTQMPRVDMGWNRGLLMIENAKVVSFTVQGLSSGKKVEIPTAPPPIPPPVGELRELETLHRLAFTGIGATLRNIKLRPLSSKAIFNGKDLAGWKVFADSKRNRSKFTVADGAIHLKDGPGDLQTDDKYGDFVLQLECKSNGSHLNSGIFFRCRPGEYQNGYEVQIRNQFTATPSQNYVVEKYDPKTHLLIGKDKIESAAVDYGTGAIYRRVPARSAAAKDGEWFTLTVVAQGNRFATWVNGIQQADWTDNRPPSDNARTGYRRAAGHISIQGHDPTTDLRFRNLRIAELPAAQ